MNSAPTGFKRWLLFNSAGAVGVGVQLAVLFGMTKWAGLNYLIATVVAVECALLHNFVWHERVTWRERCGRDARSVANRLLRFHLSNGLISIAGNLLLMRWMVGELGTFPVASNLISILICSTANFLVSDRFVFHKEAMAKAD